MNRRRFLGSIGSFWVGCVGGVSVLTWLSSRGSRYSKWLYLRSKLAPIADPHFSEALESVATRDLFESLVVQGVLTRSGIDLQNLAIACGASEIESFASQRYTRTELELYALAARIVA